MTQSQKKYSAKHPKYCLNNRLKQTLWLFACSLQTGSQGGPQTRTDSILFTVLLMGRSFILMCITLGFSGRNHIKSSEVGHDLKSSTHYSNPNGLVAVSPFSHLYWIWIPHPPCFLLSLIRQDLMMRLWQMPLGKIVWAFIIVFSVFYQIPPIAVFSFHYQIKDHFAARFV